MCEFLSSGGNWEPSDQAILLMRCFLSLPLVEACPVFFEGLSAIILALPSKALNETLDSVDANEAEKAAAEKLRHCFVEAGPQNRLNQLKYNFAHSYLENSRAA